jgi:hypothetical protein
MATMKVGAAPSDWEDEALQSQIATAQALRNKGLNDPTGQMIGDWYMAKSPWAILGQTAGGGLLEQQARGRQGELQQGREQQVADWLRQRPTTTTEQTQELAGPATPEGGALIGSQQVAKPYQQQATEMQDWATQGAQLRSPLAQSMAAAGMQQALAMPEKQLTAETAAEERRVARLEKAAADATARREKLEGDLRRDRERAQDRADLARLGASLRPPKDTQPKTVETDKGVLQWTGKAWEPIMVGDATAMPKAAGGAAGAKAEVKAAANASALRILDKMEENVKVIKEGGGYVSGEQSTPGNVGAYISNLPLAQEAQRAVGGKNQAQRDMLESRRMQLLTELKQAKGLSASEMNSNFELQKRLEALGSGRMNVQALEEILGDTRELFGGKRAGGAPATPKGGAAPKGVDQAVWDVMLPEERAAFQ